MNKESYEKIDDLLIEFESKGPLIKLNIEEAKYIKELVNENKPKLNEIYAIELNNIKSIKSVYSCHDYVESFQYRFIPVNNNYDINDDIKNSTTFIKYLGNGIFIEVYTNKIINLLNGKNIFNSKQNNSDFNFMQYKEEFAKYYNSPLYIDFNDCYVLDNISTNKFIRSNKYKDKIIDYIKELEAISRINMINSMNCLKEKDYEYAIIEDSIMNLKRINKR